MSIEGKVALVTGASSGVGRGIARVFASKGARVVSMARRHDLGMQLEKEARDAGGELTFLRGDVRSRGDCEAAVRTAVDTYGRLDILINNAGIEGDIVDFHTLTDEQWDAVLDTNLKGAFYCARASISQMLLQGGGVVFNIASMNGIPGLALAHMAPYNVSKAGLVQLTNTLAAEYLLQNIRVNTIILGGADGDTARRTQEKMGRYMMGPEWSREDDSEIEATLIQSPEDIGACLALFCSDDARLLTGATIALDRAISAGFMASTMVHMTCAQIWR
jgi:NAD(P)-dependent dehydrogenase (short-subunit alcohol dehydrogenase family)